MINAMIIDEKDNVAVVIEPVKKGDTVSYVDKNKKTVSFTAVEDIQIYHKIAIKDIPADEPVVKYGEHIGHATRDIKQGEHVHEHNVKAVRENLG